MPMLQVDGVTVAEIDQTTAASLLAAAKSGVGRVPAPAEFPKQVGAMRAPFAPPRVINLTLEFPPAV
jgi:hypothetical protein